MLIANPLYDVYFKFLMEDNEIAKEVIGTIIDEEIIELNLKPQENTFQMKEFVFTVLRMDFHAVIKTKDETLKTVIIEMQKGKYFEDLQRFRKYLGKRYLDDSLPIITIYFLGYPLDTELPAVTFVKRDYYDRYTHKKLEVKNSFIESLTHNSYLIQVLLLKGSLQSKLEAILSVFDQSKQSDTASILSYSDTLPNLEILQKMVRRLQLAGTSEELRQKAEIEDEIENSFKMMARQIQEKEEIIEESQKIIQENQKTLQENQKTLQENQKVIYNMVKLLKQAGVSTVDINHQTGVPVEEIEKI